MLKYNSETTVKGITFTWKDCEDVGESTLESCKKVNFYIGENQPSSSAI